MSSNPSHGDGGGGAGCGKDDGGETGEDAALLPKP